jgi:hypothetical protein
MSSDDPTTRMAGPTSDTETARIAGTVPAAPAAAMGARDYRPAPMPAGPYDIELGASETLSWTFRMWADSLPRLALLAFVPYVFMLPLITFAIVVMLVPDTFGHDVPWIAPAAAGVGFGVLWFVAALAAAAGIIHLVDEKARGVAVGTFQALLAGLRHVGWFFLGSLVMSALAVFAFAGPMAPVVAAIANDQPSLALLALPGLVTVVIGLVVGARLLPMLPAVVVEDLSLPAAAARAWQLTAGRATPIVGATMLFGLAWLGISMIGAMVGIVPILGVLAQMVVNALLMPLVYIFPFAVYAGCVRADQLR